MRRAREFAAIDDQGAWLARTAWRIAVDRRRRRPEPSLDDAANEALLTELREMEARMAGYEVLDLAHSETTIDEVKRFPSAASLSWSCFGSGRA